MVEVTKARITQAETEDATDEAYNLAISHCIEALTNMPSEAVREGDNIYIGRPPVDPPSTVTLDAKLT